MYIKYIILQIYRKFEKLQVIQPSSATTAVMESFMNISIAAIWSTFPETRPFSSMKFPQNQASHLVRGFPLELFLQGSSTNDF